MIWLNELTDFLAPEPVHTPHQFRHLPIPHCTQSPRSHSHTPPVAPPRSWLRPQNELRLPHTPLALGSVLYIHNTHVCYYMLKMAVSVGGDMQKNTIKLWRQNLLLQQITPAEFRCSHCSSDDSKHCDKLDSCPVHSNTGKLLLRTKSLL